MAPIALADVYSENDRPESPTLPQDHKDPMILGRESDSTNSKKHGTWAIDDEANEPVAIVGIGKSMSPPLSLESLY